MAIPHTEAELPAYATNFSAKLVASPAVYGTTASAATALQALVTAYTTAQTAVVAARETGVQSRPLIDTRNTARNAMLPQLRSFYGMIQKNITISATAKTEIGVKIPRTTPVRRRRPTQRPLMAITGVVDRTVSIVITDPGSVRRSRPADATQALVYFYAGENYPSDPNLWQFAGVSTERKFDFTVPATVAGGTRVWVCAAYTNGTGDAGPTNVPVSTAIQGTGSDATVVAGVDSASVKLAA